MKVLDEPTQLVAAQGVIDLLDRIVGGFGGPKQPVQSLDIGGRIEFLGLDQRPGDRQSPRMLLVVGLKRDLDGAEFEANRAFLGRRVERGVPAS